MVNAALTMDDDSHIRKYALMMIEKHGEDWNRWPPIGCGAKFFPWRRGASMVAELQMDDGHWEAFMADRLPTELDDAIKKCRADFVKASKMMDETEVQALMPMSFPMSFVLPGEQYMAIARYPIDEWVSNGEPVLTTMSWIKLCIKIAEKDNTNLHSILELGEKLKEREEKKVAQQSKM